MKSATRQSEASGGRSRERAPQVVVRAGKTFVCSACGTWVQVPDDVVGQWVVVADQSGQTAAVSDETATDPRASSDSVTHPADEAACSSAAVTPAVPAEEDASPYSREDRSQRPCSAKPRKRCAAKRKLPRPACAGSSAEERIDGLRVPTAGELERLLAWIDYRLKRLNELQRLEKELERQKAKRLREDVDPSPVGQGRQAYEGDAVARGNALDYAERPNERGPPD